jgi:hypothetical protein
MPPNVKHWIISVYNQKRLKTCILMLCKRIFSQLPAIAWV